MFIAKNKLHKLMKQVHNARLRAIDKDQEALKILFSSVLTAATIKPEEATITIQDDGTGELYSGELWLDHQQPVRKLVKLLLEKLSPEQKASIATHPEQYIDTQTHCFLRLSKKSLEQGEWTLADKGDYCMLRLNIAAFPATKEKAAIVLKTLFSS